jgi:hypothetical protein
MLPQSVHFQVDPAGSDRSGGLDAGSTAFGIMVFGTNDGHEPEDGLGGEGEGCWKDCGASSGSSSAMAYAAAGGRSEEIEARYERL